MSKYTSIEKRELISDINKLSKEEKIEIFKIIKNSLSKYTENNNGIFINITLLNDTVLEHLLTFVNFCMKNREVLKTKEAEVNNEKINILKSPKNKDNIKIIKKNSDTDNTINIIKSKLKIDEEDDDEFSGTKINLKKTKPKYTGSKVKLIKKGTQKPTKKNQSHNKKIKKEKHPEEEEEYLIGEENFIDDSENSEEIVEITCKEGVEDNDDDDDDDDK